MYEEKSDMNGIQELVMAGMRFDNGDFAALSKGRRMHLLFFYMQTRYPPVRQ